MVLCVNIELNTTSIIDKIVVREVFVFIWYGTIRYYLTQFYNYIRTISLFLIFNTKTIVL